MKILLAGLFHETHCFTEDITRLQHFRIDRGAALLARDDGSQIAGFLSVAKREGWEVIPAVSYEALPSGVVDHSVFETFWAELAQVLSTTIKGGLDGLFLSLHGAMVTTKEDDPEGELLRRIRSQPGAESLPIFGVFDLHATFTSAMAQHANGLLTYRQNPHSDSHDVAVEAAELLARCLKTGKRPRMHYRSTCIVWPPSGTGTADAPMSSLEARARQLESQSPDILAINVVAGFAYADAHDAGLSFSAIVEGAARDVDSVLDQLADLAWSLRFEGLPKEHDLDELLPHILPVRNGPILLVEPADNIGGGAPGDCTDVVRAMLRHGATDGGVVICDPEVVEALQAVPPGSRVVLAIGGKRSPLDPGPLTLELELVSRSDGQFELEDRHSHAAGAFGTHVNMGPCAVVRHAGLTILLTSIKTPPWDLGQWRSQGIEPGQFKIIGVKAAVGHRRAYDPISKASYTVRSRGPCTSDLTSLPYKRLGRPVFPLDELPPSPCPDASLLRRVRKS
jgi:microcystin degradation protein MlrC